MKVFLPVLLISVYSCGTLKTAHTDNVKAFARSAKVLSAVPGKLYEDIAFFRHNLKMIEVSTVHRSEKLVEELNKVAALNRRFQNNAAQINSATMLIESYAECLLALTGAAYEKQWAKQGDELSLQLETAFTSYNKMFNQKLPPSIGGFIGGVVTKVGSIKLRTLQKKYLKSFIDTGAVIIKEVCDYYTETVAMALDSEVSSLDNQFINVLSHFYDNIYEYQKKQSINSFDYLKQYNPLYMEMKEKLGDLHLLQTSTIAAMKQLKLAHQSLQTMVDASLPGELSVEIKDLYSAAKEINATLKKSEKNKKDD